jgi:hypothetical protein
VVAAAPTRRSDDGGLLRAGAEVCEALAMLWTADTQRELEGDSCRIERLLENHRY